ncbi:MAG: glucuronate isomerase [Clostridiales bacterium]|nr:glucuronate isomerase [Clostridiales bacterium]
MAAPFMNEDFLLDTETARRLYHDYAEALPIIDYHCHVSPKEIWEDRRFGTITDAWLEADHYKWRAIRSNGAAEEKVTGSASAREKFDAFAAMLEKAMGNPLYHWTHLELKRYFGYDGCLSSKTADEVWNLCNAKLKEPGMGVRGLIEQSGVEVVCTTDDPADSLEYHEKLQKDQSFAVRVLPAWRPDKAVHLNADGFTGYIAALGEAAGMEIDSFDRLLGALSRRMDFFAGMGCRASDHSLGYAFYRPTGKETADGIFQKALRGEDLTLEEIEGYQTELLLFLGREYGRRDWVMQLHLGPVRNASRRVFQSVGPDAGCDCMGPALDSRPLAAFLDSLDGDGLLPKTILYSLNPNDNALLGSLIGCFQHSDGSRPAVPGKMQQGSAWWFNDTLEGMREQLRTLASTSLLGNFVGMLTDSRSFLSYTRHEYFRRILCGLLGRWVQEGLVPADYDLLGGLVSDVSYYNAKRYFGF